MRKAVRLELTELQTTLFLSHRVKPFLFKTINHLKTVSFKRVRKIPEIFATTRLSLDGCSWKYFVKFGHFSKICPEISILINIWHQEQKLYVKTRYTFVTVSRSILLRMRNISGNFVEKIKTFFSENRARSWHIVGKQGRVRQCSISFSSLSYDRSKASSNTSSQPSAI